VGTIDGRWGSGDTAVLRYVEPASVAGAIPVRVVRDEPDLVALFIAGGTPLKWPYVAGRPIREATLEERFTLPWIPGDRTWTGDGVLVLNRPGRAHSIWLFRTEGGAQFHSWYVQLEDPHRRTRLGFDTRDHTLDAWVDLDGRWHWKDEDELEVALRHGHHTPDEATAMRDEGERVRTEWPFPTGWEDWRPDPAWALPELPVDWHVV
jgi:uncharacterized protein